MSILECSIEKGSLCMWAFILCSYRVFWGQETAVHTHFTSKKEGWEVRGGNDFWMSMCLSILFPKC